MLTQEQVKSKLNYDPETGIFTNKNGSILGCNCNKYIYIGCNGKQHYAHRLAWLYMYGYWPKVVDHINNNTKDNRISNLREATLSQNQHNSIKPKNNTSGVKGVYFYKKSQKWMARINIDYKCIYVGLFNDIEEAKNAVIAARKKYHGDFAKD